MQRHTLQQEFPEFQDKIHHLKTENNHFKVLFEKYDELEHKIYRINIGEETATDEHVHELKAKLLHLKDEVFEILKN